MVSSYNQLDEFSGDLAAKLIAGANDNGGRPDAYLVVLKLLRTDYQAALDHYNKLERDEGWTTRPPLSAAAIRSKSMLTCERTLASEPLGGTFAGWLKLSKTDFTAQEFTRAELARWLAVKNLKSSYTFKPDNRAFITDQASTMDKVPIAAAAEKPWMIPDPKDPEPAQPWYPAARHFARQLVADDSTLLTKRNLLTTKILQSFSAMRIRKRGNKKPLAPGTILKALANVDLG
jgi:hypothetical protein